MTSKKLLIGDHDDPAKELTALFGDEKSAMTWARGILDATGIPPAEQVSAIAELRRAEPRLSLKPATYLASRLAD